MQFVGYTNDRLFIFKFQEATPPTPKSLLRLSDEPSTSTIVKRKAIENDISDTKRTKVDESSCTDEVESNTTTNTTPDESISDSTVSLQNDQMGDSTTESSSKISELKPTSKQKRLTDSIIEHGEQMDVEFIPQSRYVINPISFRLYTEVL